MMCKRKSIHKETVNNKFYFYYSFIYTKIYILTSINYNNKRILITKIQGFSCCKIEKIISDILEISLKANNTVIESTYFKLTNK